MRIMNKNTSFIPIGEQILKFNMKHLDRVLPNISERILLFLLAAFPSGSHHVRYCTNMEQVSAEKDCPFGSSVQCQRRETGSRKETSHSYRHLQQIVCIFNPEIIRTTSQSKSETILPLLGTQDKDEKPCSKCLQDLFSHCSVCQVRANDMKGQTPSISSPVCSCRDWKEVRQVLLGTTKGHCQWKLSPRKDAELPFNKAVYCTQVLSS